MILTEEEAKTKWCPMARIIVANDAFYDNRGGFTNGPWTACLASQCMMWEWEVTNPDYEGPEKYHDNGFCGLKGE